VRWRYAAAKRTGTSHEQSGLPCQDAYGCKVLSRAEGSALIVVVSDGAGSAARGGAGAEFVCSDLIAQITLGFPATRPSDGWLEDCVLHTRESLLVEADRQEINARDLSATVLCAVLAEDWSAFAQVGDGAMVTPEAGTDTWSWLFWPQRGEYANSTVFLTEQTAPDRLEVGVLSNPQHEIAVFTDGLQHLVLHYEEQAVHSPFFERMMNPVRSSTVDGEDSDLCLDLERYLGSATVRLRSADDLTLVMATRVLDAAI
jgi:hypothetical protein